MKQDADYQVNLPETPFDRWAKAGYKSELLPIIPVDATLSEKSKVTADNRGKVPGLASGKEWSGFPKWQHIQADDDHIEYWSRLYREHNCGVGIQARKFPAVDIDVTDPGFSHHIEQLAKQVLGPAPTRVGLAPKALLVYALEPGAEPIRKHRVDFELPDGSKHAVEVLGDGQQYVVEGIHPKSQKPYSWGGNADPSVTGPGALNPVNVGQIEDFMDQVSALVETLGGTLKSEVKHHTGGDAFVDQTKLEGEVERIKEALDALGNDLSYDDWITMTAAVKAAIGSDPRGYDVYEAWCLEYPGNDAAVARSKWDSVHPPYKVGAEHVYRAAAAKGWKGYGAAVGFTPIETGSPSEPDEDGFIDDPNDPTYVREWAYALDQERFVRLGDRYQLTERQFSRFMAYPGCGPDDKKNPAKQFFQEPNRKLVNSMTYLPGGPTLAKVDGADCINMWLPAPGAEAAKTRAANIQDQDIAPWLIHMEKLIPDPRARATFFDWMAYVVQFPQFKPNWALFLGGMQGIGKDLAMLPIQTAIGTKNTRIVQPGELASEYTDWVAHKRLVVVEEMRNFETKAVMNKLKMYITRPPERVPVHQKYMPIYEVPNVACFIFMSNFRDALSLEKGDRRYFVYWSPMEPEAPAYYDALAQFLTGTGRDDVVAWLYARNVASFDAQGTAPDSDDKTLMQRAGLSDFQQAIFDMVEAGQSPFDKDVATLDVIWNALPVDIKRLHGAGRKRLGDALSIAGGGPVLNSDGEHRRVDLDSADSRGRYGKARLWAPRHPEMLQDLPSDMIRDLFRKAWATDELGTDDAANIFPIKAAQ